MMSSFQPIPPGVDVLTGFFMCDAKQRFASGVTVVRALVAAKPRAHFVMHVDVSHLLV